MEHSDYQGAPALAHTAERQEALRRYHILDTPPEKNFDQVTRLVAQVADVPTALITLLDEERQWFKSCFGYDRRQTDIAVSFCAHVVHERETMVVEDATKDERFKDNPLVTEEPGWRFYAGAPLRTPEGVHVGTLCIVDYEPRVFDAAQRAVLEDLADLVVGQFELRSAEAQYRKLFQGNPQPTFIYDVDTLRLLDANGAAERTYGYAEHELQGLTLPDLVAPASLDDHTDRSTEQSAPFTARHRCKDGTHLSVEVREESLLYRGHQARVATMIDVADRTRGRQYERLVENMQEVVFETDLDGQATFLNASWEEVTGFPVEDALGDSLLHYVHPKDRVDSLQAFAPLLQRRRDLFEHQTRFLTKDGAELPMQFRARLITRDGTPVGTVGTLTPLAATDRRATDRREAAPAQERADDAAPDEAVTDESVTDEAAPTSETQQPLYEVAFEAEPETAPEEEQPPASSPDLAAEPPGQTADEGSEATAPPEPDASSAPAASPTFEEEAFGEAAPEEAAEEPSPAAFDWEEDDEADGADASDEARGDELDDELFAGLQPEEVEEKKTEEGPSTESAPADEELWGSPEASAPPPGEPDGTATAEFSLDDFPALETFEGDASFAGGETLGDVRRRLSTDPPQLRTASLDFGEHLRTTLDELEPAARRKGLMMHRGLPEHAAFIEADPGALRLLVAALVNNAIASTDEGSVTVSGRAEPGEDVRLRVVDTGADISKSLLNSLLNVDLGKSEEKDDDQAQEQHLAFVHRLVNLMQGSVEMESQRGRGTVFTVALPRDPASPGEENAPPLPGNQENNADGSSQGRADDWSAWGTPHDDRDEVPAGAGEEATANAESADAESADDDGWGAGDSIFSTSPEAVEEPVDDPDAFRIDPDSPFSF